MIDPEVHITRIVGTNKDGEILPDIWIDVERIHRLPTLLPVTSPYYTAHQEAVRYLFWADDPNNPNYVPEDQSKQSDDITVVVLKVCSPDEENLGDPTEWVPIRTISQLKLINSDVAQRHTYRIAESHPQNARRIVHYDTNIDGDAQAAFNAGKRTYVVASVDYRADKATKDEGQYIEEQITTYYQALISETGSQDQIANVYIGKRHPLIDDATDPAPDAKLKETGPTGINPPYVLDPYQAIINVQMGGATKVMFGASQVGDEPPDANSPLLTLAFAIFVPPLDVGQISARGLIGAWGMSPVGFDGHSYSLPNDLRVYGSGSPVPNSYGVRLHLVSTDLENLPPNNLVRELTIFTQVADLKQGCWNHVLFTANVSPGGANKVVKCWVNGTKVILQSSNGETGDVTGDKFSDNVHSASGMIIPTTGAPFGFPPPPDQILPELDDGFRFAAVQVWFGQMADRPDLFVKADDKGNKVLQRPSVAQQALGPSYVLFDGAPASFNINKANAAFTFIQSDKADFKSVKRPTKLGVPEA